MATVTFKSLIRRFDDDDNMIIEVPIEIASESVVRLQRSNFLLDPAAMDAGDGVDGILEYQLYGSGTRYTLQFDFLDDMEGVFTINARGKVLPANAPSGSQEHYEDLTAAQAKSVSYATHVPFVQDLDSPAVITPGEIFDVVLAFNVPVTELGTDDFIWEGLNPGTPRLWRYSGTRTNFRGPQGVLETITAPTTTTTLNDVPGTDWVASANPARAETGRAKLDEVGQFFLLRFDLPTNAEGILHLSLRDHSIRGPDAS